MASHGGTIRPVSHLAPPILETVLSQEHQFAASLQKSKELSLSHRSRTGRSRYLSGVLAVLFAVLCVSSSRLEAQSTFGSIRGTVEDISGASIPDTQITLHSIDENTDRTVISDATGSYAFENVLASKYSIRARHDGFAETVVGGVVLAARQDLRYTLQMKISQQATTVEVTSSANQINTENGVLGDSKGTAEIGQLPLNFRASSTSPLAALATSADVQQDSQGNVAVGGATSNMVGYSVDGISTSNVFSAVAGANPYPSSEGIAELKVAAFNNNAEFSQVGDVTFTTKGGTNTFHGSLFEYLQNDALDARVYNFTAKAPKRFNTFGGSIGGPLLIPHLYNGHGKTFFFFDYEGNRRRTAQAQQYAVPSISDRMGDLRDIGGPVIPQASINPFATALLNKYIPLPNLPNVPVGQPNYQSLVPVPSNTDGFDARIDQVINSKQQVYARFNRKNLLVNVVNPLLPNDVDTEHDRSFLISHNYVINSRLLNEFRFGYTDTTLSPNFPIVGASALQGLNLKIGGDQGVDVSNHPTDQGFPSINFNDGTGFQSIGRDHVGPTQSFTKQIADNVTYNWGRHTIRAGVDARWVRFVVPEIETPSDDYGLFTFNQGTFTGNAFGDLLIGAPNTTYFAVTGPKDDASGVQSGIYGQDQWQVNDRLTLNFGLRWEVLSPFVDKNGIAANFDPNYSGPGANGQGAIIIDDFGLKTAPAFLASFYACGLDPHNVPNPNYNAGTCTPVVTNSQAGLPAGLRQRYLRNFDPRVSVAYRPFKDNKTVVRAGFGIFTVTALGQLQNNLESTPQASVYLWQNNNPNKLGTPIFTFPQVAPAAPPGSSGLQFGGGIFEQGVDPHYRDAQSAQWNLTVERELTSNTSVRISYIGMNSYRLNVSVNLNQATPTTSSTPNPVPFPNWGVIYSTYNLGKQNYQGMELEATHRTARGLSYKANYSWTHNISDAQGDAPTAFQGETRYGLSDLNRFDINANRGNVVGTRRQRFLVTGTYELPFGKGRQWLNSSPVVGGILGGWNVNTITLLETGPYLTPSDSVKFDQTNTNPSAAGSIVRPDRVGNPIPVHRSSSNYFDVSAFAHTPANAGRVGNAGIGSLEAPGTVAVSAGLAKVLAVRESWHLRFESTFTNVINRTNFAPPATNITNSSFGVLNQAQTAENAGNRTGQVALRLEF